MTNTRCPKCDGEMVERANGMRWVGPQGVDDNIVTVGYCPNCGFKDGEQVELADETIPF